MLKNQQKNSKTNPLLQSQITNQTIFLNKKSYNSQFFINLNTFILFLTILSNSIIVQSFSTINTSVTQYFPQITSTIISFCALIFMLIHPFTNLPINYILDNYTLKIGISINCIFVCIGLVFRLLVLENFIWVIIGNIIVALGNGFMIICPAKYSSIWYRNSNKILITSLLIFAHGISTAIGSFISPYIVKQGLTIQQGRQKLYQLIKYQFIGICIIMGINLIFFKGSPKKQQNKHIIKTQKQSYFKILSKLIKNKFFIIILLCSTTFISANIAHSTNLQLLLHQFDYTNENVGFAIILSVLFGLLSTIIFSILIHKTKQYKIIILILFSFGLVSFVIANLSLWMMEQKIVFYIFNTLCGFFFAPIIPFMIQYSCENLKSYGHATINGLSLAGGQIFSFLIGQGQSFLMESRIKQSVLYIQIINVGLLLFSLIVFSLIKQNKNQKEIISQKIQKKSLINETLINSTTNNEIFQNMDYK